MNCETVRERISAGPGTASESRAIRRHCRQCRDCTTWQREHEKFEVSFVVALDKALSGITPPDGLSESIMRAVDQELPTPQRTRLSLSVHSVSGPSWLPALRYAAVSLPIAILLLLSGIRQLLEFTSVPLPGGIPMTIRTGEVTAP